MIQLLLLSSFWNCQDVMASCLSCSKGWGSVLKMFLDTCSYYMAFCQITVSYLLLPKSANLEVYILILPVLLIYSVSWPRGSCASCVLWRHFFFFLVIAIVLACDYIIAFYSYIRNLKMKQTTRKRKLVNKQREKKHLHRKSYFAH